MGTQLQRDVADDLKKYLGQQTYAPSQQVATPSQSSFAPTSQPFNQQAATPMANVPQDTGAEVRNGLVKQAGNPYDPSNPHIKTMQDAAREYGVPYDVLHGILKTESNFDPKAKNPKSSATGMAQIIDSTGKMLGVQDRLNPIDSIYGAAKYLRQNYDKIGNWPGSIAAYEQGPGHVAQSGITNGKYVDTVHKNAGNPAGTYGDDGAVGDPVIYGAPPSYARPSVPSQQNPQPSLAGMNIDQMKAVNEALPESTRSIHTLRGNKEGWYNPQQSREFATLGESMRGQPGEVTYESMQKERIATDLAQAHRDAARITGELGNERSRNELAWSERMEAGSGKGTVDPAKVLANVEGPGGPTKPGETAKDLTPEEAKQAAEDQLEKEQEEIKKRKTATLNRWYSTPANSGT
jgi:hypothetical protein